MPKLFVVRHGKSIFNLQNHDENDPILGGQTNTQLAPEGQRDADTLGQCFVRQGITFNEAVCSELDRAHETLRRILHHQNAPVKVHDPHPGLNERSLGGFEGKKLSQVHREFPDYAIDPFKRFRSSYEVRAPGGEHYGDVEQRMADVLDPIVDAAEGNLLIVSHKHSLRAWLRRVFSMRSDQATKLAIPNTQPIVIDYDGEYRLLDGLEQPK